MKRMQSLLFVFAAAIFFTSCKPSRVWATKDKNKHQQEDRTVRNTPPPAPPRYYNSASLIISPTPGFVMNRYQDGRYYHRSQQGFLYWKGYDNRFYLDRTYLGRVSYSKWEYDQWKKFSRASR